MRIKKIADAYLVNLGRPELGLRVVLDSGEQRLLYLRMDGDQASAVEWLGALASKLGEEVPDAADA